MKNFKFNPFFTFGCLASWCAVGIAPIGAQTSERVSDLVKELSSSALSKRVDAENALLKLGPEILPMLPETVRSPEAKLRLNRIRIALERQTAEDSLEAGILTPNEKLDIQDIPAWIERETKNHIEFKIDEKQTFSWKEPNEKVSFWEFLDAFCDHFQLTPQTISGKKGLRLVPSVRSTPRAAVENPRITYLKPFRLEPVRVTSSILTASNVPSALLHLELSWEPRITPVFAYLKLTEADFFDAKGKKISENEPLKLNQGEHEILIGKNEFRSLCDIALPAKQFPENARSMTLRGSISAVACGEKKDFIFTDLERKIDQNFTPQTLRTASVLVTMTDLRSETVLSASPIEESSTAKPPVSDSERLDPQIHETQNQEQAVYSLAAVLRYRYEEPHDAMESHRTWIYENDAFLVGPDGKTIHAEKSELLRQTPNEIAAEIYFTVTKELLENLNGWKLIFPRPGGIYEVEYPFELQQIPIP